MTCIRLDCWFPEADRTVSPEVTGLGFSVTPLSKIVSLSLSVFDSVALDSLGFDVGASLTDMSSVDVSSTSFRSLLHESVSMETGSSLYNKDNFK